MNYEIAKRILDEKPSEAEHLYIDEDHIPRDRHIENLFRDAFNGAPLDQIFRTNFEVYYQQFVTSDHSRVDRRIFIDALTAMKWVSKHIGPCTFRPMTVSEVRRESADPDLAHLRWTAITKCSLVKGVPRAYAPSALHAILLSAIMVFRTEATKRLNEFFAPAIRG